MKVDTFAVDPVVDATSDAAVVTQGNGTPLAEVTHDEVSQLLLPVYRLCNRLVVAVYLA